MCFRIHEEAQPASPSGSRQTVFPMTELEREYNGNPLAHSLSGTCSALLLLALWRGPEARVRARTAVTGIRSRASLRRRRHRAQRTARNAESRGPAARDCTPLEVAPPELITTPFDVPLPPLVDPEGRALASFYRRFAELLRGKATDHVRIAVYGDSNLTEDLLTGEMRRVLQARYGDAGHGYVAFGKPWAWYRHMDVEHDLEPRAWHSFAVSTDAARDQAYGLGGIAAESLSGGARAWVRTAPSSAPVGTRVSRIHVFYLERPGGGRFKIRVDGEDLATIATERDRLATGYRQLSLPDGPHGIGFVADRGVRLFGVALERETPGIVIDSLGVGGANEVLLARMNPAIVREALAIAATIS